MYGTYYSSLNQKKLFLQKKALGAGQERRGGSNQKKKKDKASQNAHGKKKKVKIRKQFKLP